MGSNEIKHNRYGELVAFNLRRYRDRAGVGYAELSRRLTHRDRPINPLGLKFIERGQRRVDVDDLCALADCLEIPPIWLLLPGRADQGDASEVMAYLIGGARTKTSLAGHGQLSAKVAKVEDSNGNH